MNPSIPILCYRNISPVCGITPDEFRSHLDWLDANEWTGISIDQVLDYLKKGTRLPAKSYLMTFDDCYLDNWIHAAPLLREYKVKAAFGCVTAFLHDGPCRPDSSTPNADLRELPVARDAWDRAIERNDPTAFMNRTELRVLIEEQGHSLFGHTHTHQVCFRSNKVLTRERSDIHPSVHGIYLEVRDGQPMYPSGSAYAHNGFWPESNDLLDNHLIERSISERIEFCLNEFMLCRERLEELTGRPARVMSWPWGEYDSVSIEAALLSGYEAALSMDTGPNVPGKTPLFALRRVKMQGGVCCRELKHRLRVAGNPLLAGLFRKTYRVPKA